MNLPEVLHCERVSVDALELLLRIPPELLYFKGHFPHAPVLPGVVQIHWAQHFARQYLGLVGVFRGMEALKFQEVIQPGEEVTLQLDHARSKGKLSFRYQATTGRRSSGTLLFDA